MTVEQELSWFALRVQPQKEQAVRDILVRRGMKAFIKTEKRAVHHSARASRLRKRREARRFCAAPGYVFVGASKLNPWMLVHENHMISSVVSREGRPAILHPMALSDFLGFDDFNMPDAMMWFRRSQQAFNIGDMVHVDLPYLQGFTLPVKDIQKGEAIFDLVFPTTTTELRVPLEDCYKAA